MDILKGWKSHRNEYNAFECVIYIFIYTRKNRRNLSQVLMMVCKFIFLSANIQQKKSIFHTYALYALKNYSVAFDLKYFFRSLTA